MVMVPEGFKPCIADLSPPERSFCAHWHIHRINVPWEYRGKGYGTQILNDITNDADRDGITLCLVPVPSAEWSKKTLVDWYKRHGFVWDQCVDSKRLIRYPVEIPSRQGES
jgi:GNAT superfamily N-acetyltransferase